MGFISQEQSSSIIYLTEGGLCCKACYVKVHRTCNLNEYLESESVTQECSPCKGRPKVTFGLASERTKRRMHASGRKYIQEVESHLHSISGEQSSELFASISNKEKENRVNMFKCETTPKMSPGAYIFQRTFLRGLHLEGPMIGGKFAF